MIYSHANPLALRLTGATSATTRSTPASRPAAVCVNGVGRFLGDPAAGTAAIIRHIDYLVQRIGAEHVGLGIDYEYDQGLDEGRPASIGRTGGRPRTATARRGRASGSPRPSSSGDHRGPARPRLSRGGHAQHLGANMSASPGRYGGAPQIERRPDYARPRSE